MAAAGSVGAVVAATDRAGSVVAAALALPLLGLSTPGTAQTLPEHGQVSWRMLDYQDWQPGLKRVRVRAPAVHALLPISSPDVGDWSLEASWIKDTISGASPRYHTQALTRLTDVRKAQEARVTRHRPWGNTSFGLSFSDEADYVSKVWSFNLSLPDESRNTTWHVGVARADDRIHTARIGDRNKQVTEWLLGLTQVLTPADIVQVNLTHSRGKGYFSDPYKALDNRPDSKRQTVLLVRWNHHFEESGLTARLSARHYQDSYRVKAQTFGAEFAWPLNEHLTLTPSLRLHNQSAASFYVDPVVPGEPTIPEGLTSRSIISEDQRLSGFGARTLGLRLAWRIDADWTFDIKAEHYEQRGSWAWLSRGSPGLAPFSARFVQLGLARRF